MPYKGARRPLPVIARELNVDAIVEGTVIRSGDQVRITAQLIQAATDKHLWAESYQGDVRNMLALQKQVARAIADQIRIELTPSEQAVLKNAKPVKIMPVQALGKLTCPVGDGRDDDRRRRELEALAGRHRRRRQTLARRRLSV
jgi:hypothetical protein